MIKNRKAQDVAKIPWSTLSIVLLVLVTTMLMGYFSYSFLFAGAPTESTIILTELPEIGTTDMYHAILYSKPTIGSDTTFYCCEQTPNNAIVNVNVAAECDENAGKERMDWTNWHDINGAAPELENACWGTECATWCQKSVGAMDGWISNDKEECRCDRITYSELVEIALSSGDADRKAAAKEIIEDTICGNKSILDKLTGVTLNFDDVRTLAIREGTYTFGATKGEEEVSCEIEVVAEDT